MFTLQAESHKNVTVLRYLGDIFSSRVQTLASNEYNIAGAVKESDLVIGSVLLSVWFVLCCG